MSLKFCNSTENIRGGVNCPSKLHLSAPLPFVGQKRMFARRFIDIIKQYPAGTVFVDLFGGSGLLSHITKYHHPRARVIYNDFDNYRRRIANIPRTNALLQSIRPIASEFPRNKLITGVARDRIIDVIAREERDYGYVDYITLSASLLFSMKYRTSLEALRKEGFYNRIRQTDYPICSDYLSGLEIVSCDYMELFEHYKDTPGVVFLVDPPYLFTETGTYSESWRLADYLDVLTVLAGHSFIYFTSDKSSIIELCEWMGRHQSMGNPFERCLRADFNASMNFNSHYTDIMLFTPQ
ncbi:DNA adenine methylase [Muribaculum intestinale]|uniref:DNA adenine methylase n=1 Tax=Muribaculum intestinale TaxID=1796646 RepID=UPI0025A578B5|nr:DNA adenine methylase [Muribaculum intestinale]